MGNSIPFGSVGIGDRPSPLSVLHLSCWDNEGGSGRSAYRLHSGLKQLGIRSRMLVGRKQTHDPDVKVIGGNLFGRLDRLGGGIADRMDLQYLFYPSSFLLNRTRWVREADVIQVFNTHGGYFSHLSLIPLSQHRTVVWRLSDMWAMTGHCAYSYECERWETGCGSCPHLEEYPRLRMDTSALLWRVKDWIYERARLTIVAPSTWMASLVRRSPLLSRFPVYVIPNGLDTETFRPVPKPLARERLGLGPQERVVLFSAASLLDHRKGGAILREAINRAATEGGDPVTLLVMGRHGAAWQADSPFQTVNLGYVESDEALATAYSAADVFVLPALAENLPNSVLESMACGTPVLSFDVGGIAEAVRHMETGYLAAKVEAADLARGLRVLLDSPELRGRLGSRCREVALQEYPAELEAQRFVSLYRDVTGQSRLSREAEERAQHVYAS